MIEDPHFTLDLGPAWTTVPGDQQPGSYAFLDEERDIAALLSARATNILPDDLDFFARLLIDVEMEKETTAARVLGCPSTIYEPIIAPQPWGRAMAYYGHDAGGRQFGFSGMITCRCWIGLSMWTGSLTEQELLAAMDDLSSRIVFDRTPLYD